MLVHLTCACFSICCQQPGLRICSEASCQTTEPHTCSHRFNQSHQRSSTSVPGARSAILASPILSRGGHHGAQFYDVPTSHACVEMLTGKRGGHVRACLPSSERRRTCLSSAGRHDDATKCDPCDTNIILVPGCLHYFRTQLAKWRTAKGW